MDENQSSFLDPQGCFFDQDEVIFEPFDMEALKKGSYKIVTELDI